MTRPGLPGGVVPPIPTFLDGEQLDGAHQRALLDRLYAAGVDGVLTLGSAGEGPALDDPVRSEAITVAVEAMQGRPVVVGCSGQTARAVGRQIAVAADLGASSALVLPPFYFTLSQDSMVRYFLEVADHAAVPILLYHIPGMTGNPFAIPTIERLAEHPRVAGIKDSQGDFIRFLQLHRRLAGEEFIVFQGVAALVGPSLLAGCEDAMCTVTALFPEPELSMRAAIAARDLETVRHLMHRISAVTELFRLGSYPLPSNIKAIADLVGIGPGRPHDPALTPDDSHRDQLAAGLAELGFLPKGAER